MGILTNRVILADDSFFEKVQPYLLSRTVTLCISLDSLSPKLHDEIRGKTGAHEATLKVLKKLYSLKRIYPSIEYMVITILLNQNLEEILSLLNFLKELQVDKIQIQPILDNNLYI